jgi:HSP20 family protein
MASNTDRTSTSGATSTPARTGESQAQGSRGLSRRDPFDVWGTSPFGSLFRRWNDDMSRFFDDALGRAGLQRRSMSSIGGWAPQVEAFQRGNELVVRADLPGLSKDDIQVDIADDVLTIQGERKQEHEEEQEGWYRNEREYGSFYRAIPLPQGTIADSAKATFKKGVLEVVLQAPSEEVSRGRRLEISEGTEQQSKSSQK